MLEEMRGLLAVALVALLVAGVLSEDKVDLSKCKFTTADKK